MLYFCVRTAEIEKLDVQLSSETGNAQNVTSLLRTSLPLIKIMFGSVLEGQLNLEKTDYFPY